MCVIEITRVDKSSETILYVKEINVAKGGLEIVPTSDIGQALKMEEGHAGLILDSAFKFDDITGGNIQGIFKFKIKKEVEVNE